MTSEERAELLTISAYAAYGQATGWTNFAGNPMPEWHELPTRIQDAWRASVRAVVAELAVEHANAAGKGR